MSQTFTQSIVPTEVHEKMIEAKSISDDAPVPINRLRHLKISYIDFDGKSQDGEMIVLDVCADAVLSTFKSLYNQRFPIAKMKLITEYGGDDNLSMEDNNTSSHNFRSVAGTTTYSLHSYGTAIDINPVQNPYIIFNEEDASARFLPPNSLPYANRMLKRLNKKERTGFAEEVVGIFAENGFYWWGGYWDTPIDYQHFQLDRQISYILASMDYEEGKKVLETLTDHYNKHGIPLEMKMKQNIKSDKSLSEIYLADADLFYKLMEESK